MLIPTNFIFNFTYSCLYASLIKVVSVDNVIRTVFTIRTNLLKLKFWKLLSNSYATFDLENVNLIRNCNINSKVGVAYKKRGGLPLTANVIFSKRHFLALMLRRVLPFIIKTKKIF